MSQRRRRFSNIGFGGPDLRDVLVCDGERRLGASEIFTANSVSGTLVQITAYSPWQKGRIELSIATHHGSGGQDDFATPSGENERHVDCQLRGCPRTESKSREVGHTHGHTSFWPANECLRRTDGTRGGRSPSEGVGRRRRAGQTFHCSGVSARGLEQLPRVPSQ